MKKKTIVLQEERSDCGACCLLSIIRYYHGNANLEDIRILSNTTDRGVNAYNLIQCAKTLGFDAKGLSVKEIKPEYLPCIAHLNISNNLSHFVVIYSLSKESILIMDPSQGFRKVSYSTFNSQFSGVVIILYPKGILPKYSSQNMVLHSYFQNYKAHKWLLLGIIILQMSVFLGTLINSTYFIWLDQYPNSLLLFAIFGFVLIIKNVFNYLEIYLTTILNRQINIAMVIDFFSYIFKLPLKYLHLKPSGEIIKRVDDLYTIKEAVTAFIVTSFNNILIISCLLIIFSLLSPYLVLLICIFTLLFWGILWLLHKRVNNYINLLLNSQTEFNQFMTSYIESIISINHTHASNYFLHKLSSKIISNENNDQHFKITLLQINFLGNFIKETLTILLNFGLFIFLMPNKISWTILFSLNLLFNLYFDAINNFSNIIPISLYLKNVIRRINNFYSLDNRVSGSSTYHYADLIFDHVSFSYNQIDYILTDINLVIKPQAKVLIKGSTGKGKSTFCRLLNNELNPTSGHIYMGGICLNDIKNYQQHVTYASQNEKIVLGTIKENICMGKELSTDSVAFLCQICALDEVIMRKKAGLDTFLLGGALELSGGEKQRILLARALANESDIFVLDECLSEVDSVTENQILQNIMQYYADKTIIYVTHRPTKNYFSQEICV